MNTQEHIKNCKECGNGFYHQGLDVCQTCKVKRQGGYTTQWTNAERQAMAAQNHAHVTLSSMDVQRQIDTLNIMSAALPTDEEIKGYFKDWEKQETMLTENPIFKILFWSVLIIALIVSAVLAVV